MVFVTVLGGILGFVFESLLFSLAFVFGGLLSFANYYWLKVSLKRVFEGAVEGNNPGIFGAQYILRYMAFGLLLALIYLTKTLPIIGVILGLSSFAFAVVIEGVLRIFGSLNNKKEI